jgi:Polyketide cyclase / dehydrase and lipid transport
MTRDHDNDKHRLGKARLVVSVCPADRVNAPVEAVWDLLMHPAGYGRFWDLTIGRVEPDGPAQPGQKFGGWKLFKQLRIAGEVLEVDAEHHQIRFRTTFPLGIVGDNRISCTAIDAGSCMLRYG